ncbi:MAG: aspartate aminotransferase family protein [Acidiferrobacteraceae bacterium]|nr:aspartate aminotransferase family protein [Acidiferrobacteraceae bacterium]
MSTPRPMDLSAVRRMDAHVVHPWESFDIPNAGRTVLGVGDGSYVFDAKGNRLLDGPGGMWCVNAGHGQTKIVEAIHQQAAQLSYTSPWSHPTEPAARLAERLAAVTPGDLDHVFYATGGSTAVDSALRFMMFYNNVLDRPQKKHIISRHDAYHGSTYLSAAVSGKPRDKNWLDTRLDTVHFISSPNPYRRPEGMDVDGFKDFLVKELEDKILEVGPDKVGAFIAEPILASGGVIVPPAGYHAGCLEVCRRHDVIYISDEVVTGFGRLGHWFASEPVFDITPDIIISAKGLTSGYIPLSCVIISDRLIQAVSGDSNRGSVFSNGFTYSGHPVACAAGIANMEVFESQGLLENALEVGPYMQEQLRTLSDLPIVGDIRGMGLMGCLECVASRESRQPLELDYEVGSRIDKHCQALGLLVRPLINMCVMSPPLCITREQIDEMISILREGISRTMADLEAEGIAEFH